MESYAEPSSKAPVGVIHGRFQPLHWGHMEYLLEGKQRCQRLIVGITNPDPGLTATNAADPKRSLSSSNPLTYYERLLVIQASLLEAGVSREEFDVVPFPINYPDLYQYYVPLNARFFVTVYDQWGLAKVELLKSAGLDVDVMWTRTMADRFTSGTEVRQLMASGKSWSHLVPPAAAQIIIELGLQEKVAAALLPAEVPHEP